MLGLFSYYRTYVPDFAAIAKPLTDLTAKRQPFMLQWGAQEQSAFEILRTKISEAPVLLFPKPGQPFLLYTDESATSAACYWCQFDDNGKSTQSLTPVSSLLLPNVLGLSLSTKRLL